MVEIVQRRAILLYVTRKCTEAQQRPKRKVPNLGFANVGAALVGLSALVLQVLGSDAGDTTLQDRRDAETSAADLRGNEEEEKEREEEEVLRLTLLFLASSLLLPLRCKWR